MFFDRLRRAPRQRPRCAPGGTRYRVSLEPLEARLVPAATFPVTTTVDVVDPADGKLSLREAITAANKHAGVDVIVLPAGVFKIARDGSDNDNTNGDFDVSDGVSIQGAGAGQTAIDGQGKDRLFDLLGEFGVTFSGVTLRHGGGQVNGGAVQALTAKVSMVNCVVRDNSALKGGGINAENGNVTLVGTVVGRNVARDDGGGICLGNGVLRVSGSRVRRNLAGGNGGGIFTLNRVTLTNSIIADNEATLSGGGLFAGEVELSGCTLSGNLAFTGGAVRTPNTADVINSTISGNSALGNGGGIHAGTLNLTNSTVSGNTARNIAGGISVSDGAILVNDTITENAAVNGGGGFFEDLTNPQSIEVRNTIIAGNFSGFGKSSPDIFGAFESQGHNFIGVADGTVGFLNGEKGDIVGSFLNPKDPLLGPLSNNGGRTKTHALLPGSLAIDHGDNSVIPLADQRGTGFARRKDGNGDGRAVVDIGAFER